MEKNNAQNGSISDINGDFSLSVSPGAVIVISYIGYVTQELKAIAGAPLKVVLKDDSRTLDEVVVVGFGSQKKANLTGAVSSIKMDEIIGDRPIMTASDALQGTVPGLLVSNSGNAPVAESHSSCVVPIRWVSRIATDLMVPMSLPLS